MLRTSLLLFAVLTLFTGCLPIKIDQYSTSAELERRERESTAAELERGRLAAELAAAKNPKSKKAPFDPKSPEDRRETVNWVRSVWKEYNDVAAKGNPAQTETALYKVGEQLEQLRGKEVRWPFRVSYLGNDGQKDFVDIAASDTLPPEYQFKTARMVQPGNVARFYKGDDDLSEEAYDKLTKNSYVTLYATIKGDFVHHFMLLDDCKIVESE